MHASDVDTELPGRRRGLAPSTAMAVAASITSIVVAATRWAFSADRRVFHISPDEASQVAIARWLAGGRWNMFDHATWQPGLGTLMTPILWFTDDGTTVVQAALALNAAIAGLSAAVLVVVTRRLTGLGPFASAAVAIAVAVAPSSLSASSFVWAEPLVSLCLLGTVALLFRWFDRGRVATGVAAIAVAVAGYTSHSRLLVLAGTTVALTVGVAAWRRRWTDTAILAVATAALLGASAIWTRWLLSSVWDDPSDQNTIGSVWERAQQPVDVAEALLGQLWYQGAATVGLAFVGAAVLVGAAVPSRRPADDESDVPLPARQDRPLPVDARVLLSTVIPLIGLSAIFMSDRPRPDQFVYGRYNDAVVWPIIAVGLAWLVRRATVGFERRHAWWALGVLVSVVGLGRTVEALHGDAIRQRYGVRSMIAGLLAFVDDNDTLDVWRTTVVSAVIFASLVAVAAIAGARPLPATIRRSALAIGVVAGAGLLIVAGVRTEKVADLRLNGWERTNAVRLVDELVPEGVPLGVRPVPNSQDPVVEWVPQRQRFQLYQLWLPDRTFVRDRGVDDDVGPYVFAPLDDPTLVEAGAELLWRDPGIRVGLWREPDAG